MKNKLYWDYAGDEGDLVEVEIVDCELNRELKKRIENPTNLTELSFIGA